MAELWPVLAAILWCFGACEGSICTRMTYHNYLYSSTSYIYCDYGCCGSSYNRYCCTSSGTIAGVVIAVLCGVAIVAFLACLCAKKQKRGGRIVAPGSTITHSNLTVVYAGVSGPGSSNYRGAPPAPPPYKANDPPPPYSYGHFTVSNTGPNNRERINTGVLPTGSYNPPPPSQPPPARRDQPPQYPPMPQPNPPPRNITSPAPPYTPRAAPEESGSVLHPPPGPLPPATAPVSHTQ